MQLKFSTGEEEGRVDAPVVELLLLDVLTRPNPPRTKDPRSVWTRPSLL